MQSGENDVVVPIPFWGLGVLICPSVTEISRGRGGSLLC